jgi:hypothetical protein
MNPELPGLADGFAQASRLEVPGVGGFSALPASLKSMDQLIFRMPTPARV